MSGPSCRGIRELLGVYVVGAIEPAERATVDGHLAYCPDCREELGGLAGLPALLRRVPLADAERIAGADAGSAGFDEPQPELLAKLVSQVTAQRRRRRLRAVFAIAAALLICAGGTGAIVRALTPQSGMGPPTVADIARKSNGTITAVVRYGPRPGGSQMWILTRGIPQGTTCKFWILTRHGKGATLASGWTVGPGADRIWYPADSPVPTSSIDGFLITSGGKVLLRIPAPD